METSDNESWVLRLTPKVAQNLRCACFPSYEDGSEWIRVPKLVTLTPVRDLFRILGVIRRAAAGFCAVVTPHLLV